MDGFKSFFTTLHAVGGTDKKNDLFMITLITILSVGHTCAHTPYLLEGTADWENLQVGGIP